MEKKSNKSKKKCTCWSCKLSPKIRKFEQSLDADKLIAFREIFDEVWDRLEAHEMDLGVLEAKIDGSWPKSDDSYYHRVCNALYKIESTKVEENHDANKPNK